MRKRLYIFIPLILCALLIPFTWRSYHYRDGIMMIVSQNEQSMFICSDKGNLFIGCMTGYSFCSGLPFVSICDKLTGRDRKSILQHGIWPTYWDLSIHLNHLYWYRLPHWLLVGLPWLISPLIYGAFKCCKT